MRKVLLLLFLLISFTTNAQLNLGISGGFFVQQDIREPFCFGNALDFDGIDDDVTFPALPNISGDYTISFWSKAPTQTGFQTIVYLGNGSASEDYIVLSYQSSNVFRFQFRSGVATDYQFETTYTPNVWTQYGVSRIGSQVKMYVNGAVVDSNSSAAVSNTVLGDLFWSTFRGILAGAEMTLDEFIIADGYGATDQDMLDLYNSGEGNYADEVLSSVEGYWRLDGTSGDTTAIDETGTYNGTLNSFNTSAAWVVHRLCNVVDRLSPVLYLDAGQNVTESGGAVSAWGNLGIGGTSATQSTGSAQPTYNATGFGVNSLPYLDFDGSAEFMTLGTEYSKLPNHTVFVVWETDTISGNQDIIRDLASSGSAPTGSIRHGLRVDTWETSWGNGSTFRFYQDQTTTLASNTPYLTVDTKTDGVNINSYYLNGTQKTLTDFNGGTGTNIGGTAYNMSIGRAGDFGGQYLNGKIAEIIVFDYVLNSTQLNQVTTYLQDKYGL